MPSAIANSRESSDLSHGALQYDYVQSFLEKPSPQPEKDVPRRIGAGDGSMSNGRLANGRANGQVETDRRRHDSESARGSSDRDDGSFAAAQHGDTWRKCRTTHVKLQANFDATQGSVDEKSPREDVPISSQPEAATASPKTSPTNQSERSSADGMLQVPGSTHRMSSPPALSRPGTASSAPLQPTVGSRLQQRHTLEVPRAGASRGVRDPGGANPPEEGAVGPGAGARVPPSTPTRRRGSITLGRRPVRSTYSDLQLDEVAPDDDAARWAEHIRQKRASKRRRKEDEDDDRVVVGTKVDQNHVNWVTAYNMLTGIRFTVSRTNAKIDRDLTDADFDAKQKFSFDITGNELTPSAKYDFKFKDYAPWVFRHLRSIFRLDPADYLMSLTSKYILSELGSPGKSGSFFYFSRDYKYIIKTIHHAEHKFLRKILRDYYNHVQANPNTLLSQFYGLHRVKIPYGRKIHFVVMNNLFPPHRDIHRTFDLKGSTIGRDFKEENLENNPRATLKDLNWLRRNLHLEFGPTKKTAFIEQMEKDVELLQRLKIMDYSLLVGIHDLERGNEDNLRDKTLQVFQPGGESADDPMLANALARTPSKLENARKAKELRQMIKTQKPIPMEKAANKMPDEMQEPSRKDFYFYSDDGGFRATHEDDHPGEEIYYLGIIDCLTYYSFIKRTEHFLKGMANTESQISAIPPDRYGDRFVRFISGIAKTRERAEAEEAEKRAAAAAANEQQELSPLRDPRLGPTTASPPMSPPQDPVLERAERAAEQTRRHGAREDDVPRRVLSTARSPSAERGEIGNTLPVVEEAAESGSVGGRSQGGRSDGSPNPGAQQQHQHHHNHHHFHGDEDQNLQRHGTHHYATPDSRQPQPHDDPAAEAQGNPPPTPPKDSSHLHNTNSHHHPRPRDSTASASAATNKPLPRLSGEGPPTPPRDEFTDVNGGAAVAVAAAGRGRRGRGVDKELPVLPDVAAAGAEKEVGVGVSGALPVRVGR